MTTYNIYFLYDVYKNLLYIGKTKSLRARFHGHFNRTLVEKEPWRNEIDTDNIIIYTCLNDCDLDIYETYFINKYKPKYNKDKVYSSASSFELSYLEPNQYSFDSKRPKGFQRSFIEYMDLRENSEEDNKELIESYELENSLFKEAYEKLGRKVINSCKYNEQTIKEKLFSNSNSSIDTVKEKLKAKYKSGDLVPIKEVKNELKDIYNTLNIKINAKGSDICKYLPASITERKVNNKSYQVVKFL